MKKASNTAVAKYGFKHKIAVLLIIGGLLGLFASFTLLVDKIEILKDPGFQPICNINPVFSCSSVMKSSQSELFGVPSTIFGIIGYTATIVTGIVILAGATLKRWYWLAFNIGQVGAIGFVIWLFTQSVFELKTICLFCMLTWFSTIPLFWYTTVYNLREGHIVFPARMKRVNDFIQTHHGDIIAVFYVIFIAIILKEFWYYWETLLP